MIDPFAVALGAIFRAPGSIAAEYRPAAGDAIATRAIRNQPSERLAIGAQAIVVDSNLVSLQRSDVAAPAAGDSVQLGGFVAIGSGDPVYRVVGRPMLDDEGLSWTVELGDT